MALIPAERALCKKLNFDPNVAELLKAAAKKPVEQMQGAKPQSNDWAPVAGLSAKTTEDAVQEILAALQPQLPAGYSAFYGERNAAGDAEIAVLKTSDRFEIVRAKATDAVNYELETEDIVARLQQWQQLCRLHIAGAGHDWVFLEFETLPDNLDIFAREIYDFCPDTIDQHFGSFGDMAEVTEETGQELPEHVRKVMDGLDWNDPTAAGLEMLKCSLENDKSLFLWWD